MKYVYGILFIVSILLCAKSVSQVPRLSDDIFRQYDIRGIVPTELPVDATYDLGRAIAQYFAEHKPHIRTIAVGADGRVHSPAIKKHICTALQDAGFDVIFVGYCSSPVVYYALHTQGVDAGVMITASHNPKEYNGIKIHTHDGPLWGADIQEIKKLYHMQIRQGDPSTQADAFAQGERESKADRLSDPLKLERRRVVSRDGMHADLYREAPVVQEYITYLCNQFGHLRGMNLNIVIDCGNGAAGFVLPELVHRMQWPNVQLLYAEVDGNYPNHTADPTVEKYMHSAMDMVKHTDVQFGMGLDGDCDRMAAIDESGNLVVGDKLLSIFAQDIAARHPGFHMVFDIKCSSGLTELLDQSGVTWQQCPTGSCWVSSYMKESDALLGGELSCHLFFADRYFGYDDGIYAMLRLLEIVHMTGKTVEQLLAPFPYKVSSPEIRFACKEQDKQRIMAHIEAYFSAQPSIKMLTIDGVHVTFDVGWGIVRPSNTQPVLSARFEADDAESLAYIKKQFIASLTPFYDVQYLHGVFTV